MSAFHPAGPIAGSLIALALLALALRQTRRKRLLADLPTSKVRGVFIGLVELKGTAESEAPLASYLAARPCVDYRWRVEEHWRRTRVESYTDSKGNRRTRTRTDTGWSTVAEGGDTQSFYLRDDTGVILVQPAGASVDRADFFFREAVRGDPLYYGKGPDGAVSGSTGRRRFTETGIPLHAPLYVVGDARERPDIVAPRIADADGAEFIISTRDEQSVSNRMNLGAIAALVGALAAAPLGLVLAASPELPRDTLYAQAAAAAASVLALWGLGWAWMAHNSIVGLRERVRSAWSLIDVQLKRRHDLFPALNRAVAALSAHERETQVALAALRTQSLATRPGAPGPEFDGVARELRVLVERHPELRAQEGFSALERELSDTENRIALARAYYNEIASHYATRLEQIPDRWIAALRKLRPEPLLTAAHFERAAVEVKLAE